MPFKSKAQEKWMFANKPKMAKKWAEETPSMTKLPEKKVVMALMKRKMSG